MTRRADVLVVGAGPAGCAAAATLARAGRDAVVVDKARFPRDKVCGDGLTAGALPLLEELGVDPASIPSWQRVDDVVVAPPRGRPTTFSFPRDRGTYAAAARRVELDAAVVDAARAAGAEVHDGCALESARQDDALVRATVRGLGEVTAPYVVGADGMWSPLRKCMGVALPGYRGESHAFRQYLRGVASPARRDLWVWFEPDLLPGYAWSFPLGDGAVNVGFGIHRGGRVTVREMAEVWRSLLRRPRLAAVLGDDWEAEGPHRAWPIPARVDRIPLTAGRALFVGDAAAATDPMTGEGIGQALETGMAAARAVLAAGPGAPDTATAAYEREVRRGLARDNQLAASMLRLLRHRRGAELGVRLAGATPWTRRNFARWMFEDYPRAVLATPHRWHRGVLTGPGSYR
ncbi:geranylgeranyl reductase family protein [Iamia majanohamensis]|uniref:Geranylgeranyl reductase family protein n=1 Tax=Iamia majanohamensis TaxID=467976 RepID=A0AAF0BR18_9ACTN|nr:geranylgeranyl reductase family protein [Iamia majanohamensis]WCO65826.1 geranylgeranyl reductase family protein [Iamia majanohamensis]